MCEDIKFPIRECFNIFQDFNVSMFAHPPELYIILYRSVDRSIDQSMSLSIEQYTDR